ncbi:MAG: hypothetical protein KGL39_55625 [Patescibacteria group bacterium]|nr:hypothetical protein [Patescibacteria group bacterium]
MRNRYYITWMDRDGFRYSVTTDTSFINANSLAVALKRSAEVQPASVHFETIQIPIRARARARRAA